MNRPATGPLRGIELPPVVLRARQAVPGPARRALKWGARGYGGRTAAARPLPDFVIIGTKKGGTSSLMNWLLRHTAVARMFPAAERVKSPHYFDFNYWRGPRWYRSHFATRAARRRTEDKVGALTVTGEASPYYMFHPAAAARATELLPAVRVIALLRNPVSRAYSNFWDRKAFGTEELDTFEQALAAEPQRLATVDEARLMSDPHYYSFEHDHHSYLARGHYAEQLRRWMDRVPAERMLVLSAEDMFTDPQETFDSVQRFLQIPIQGVQLDPFNARPQVPMDPDTRANLFDHYRPHNAELYDLLGRDLGWDKTP